MTVESVIVAKASNAGCWHGVARSRLGLSCVVNDGCGDAS